jgi:hypothetical protein
VVDTAPSKACGNKIGFLVGRYGDDVERKRSALQSFHEQHHEKVPHSTLFLQQYNYEDYLTSKIEENDNRKWRTVWVDANGCSALDTGKATLDLFKCHKEKKQISTFMTRPVPFSLLDAYEAVSEQTVTPPCGFRLPSDVDLAEFVKRNPTHAWAEENLEVITQAKKDNKKVLLVTSGGLLERDYQRMVSDDWLVIARYPPKPTPEEYATHYIPCDVMMSSADLVVHTGAPEDVISAFAHGVPQFTHDSSGAGIFGSFRYNQTTEKHPLLSKVGPGIVKDVGEAVTNMEKDISAYKAEARRVQTMVRTQTFK